MAALLTQTGKSLAVSTPLGPDELLLTSFSGAEHISRPFTFRLEMISLNDAIDPTEIVGSAIDVTLTQADGSERYFNGVVNQFVAGERHQSGYRIYQAEIVPWVFLLKYFEDCRIFQEKDAKTIIEEVFQSRGFSDFEFSTQRGFRTRTYTVQYRESDFQFVSRLMEEEGIFYYFKQEDGKHTMVLGDAVSNYEACDEAEARYFESGGVDDHLNDWSIQSGLITGKWSQNDYNFETPSTSLLHNVSTIVDLPNISDYEKYDYPGSFGVKADGEALTRIRIEEEETQHKVVFGAGTYRSYKPGGTFSLERHDITSEQGNEYVITSITHYARENSYESGSGGAFDYRNQFTCIPSDVVFRAPSRTRKPFVQGPQTAVVVGPSGEEIYTDEYGRIKVQFHWDRVGAKDDKSSCWVRVGQQMAGQQWGAIFIPRIGHEVIVSFLEGDPDQPLVTGCVYNAQNMPPYELPANKTQSGWKTRSSKGGGAANFNEIRFEDLKGSEEVYIHAEKDQNNVVENDESTDVGNDRTEHVGNNETITIDNNRTESVGENESISIGKNRTEDVGENETISIGKNRTVDVAKNETISIGDNQSISIGKDQNEDIGKAMSLTIGDKRSTQVGKDDALDVGKKYTLTAADQITLKTGKASIVMKKDGTITISGKDVTVKASGKFTAKASKDAIVKGSKVSLN